MYYRDNDYQDYDNCENEYGYTQPIRRHYEYEDGCPTGYEFVYTEEYCFERRRVEEW